MLPSARTRANEQIGIGFPSPRRAQPRPLSLKALTPSSAARTQHTTISEVHGRTCDFRVCHHPGVPARPSGSVSAESGRDMLGVSRSDSQTRCSLLNDGQFYGGARAGRPRSRHRGDYGSYPPGDAVICSCGCGDGSERSGIETARHGRSCQSKARCCDSGRGRPALGLDRPLALKRPTSSSPARRGFDGATQHGGDLKSRPVGRDRPRDNYHQWAPSPFGTLIVDAASRCSEPVHSLRKVIFLASSGGHLPSRRAAAMLTNAGGA